MQVTKDYLQERGVLAFQRGHGFLFAEFSMGVGKTKLAIDIIRHLKRNREGWIKVLYICHTTASRDITTPDEFRQWDAYHLLESGEVTLVQYEKLDEISHMSYDLVIFDECHLITARRYEFFNRNVAVRILLLTGTRPDNGDKMEMLRRLCRGNMLNYNMEQATKHGTVNDITFKLVFVDMDPQESVEYYQLSNRITRLQSQMPQAEWAMTIAVNRRMWFIYKSITKLRAMQYMANGMREKERRFLMFTPTKEQARALSSYTMYSGKKDTDFKSFCNQEINELCSVKQIESGANIPNLKYALCQQINSKKHNIRQMAGRLLRGDVNDIATFWVIVLRSTVDEKWAEEAIQGIPSSKIRRIELKREEFMLTAI
jgi:superfamily II DNA or RNA helicase